MKFAFGSLAIFAFVVYVQGVPQAGGSNGTISQCMLQAAGSAGKLVRPCAEPMKGIKPPTLTSSAQERADFVLAVSKGFCSEQCFTTVKQVRGEIDAKCANSDQKDITVTWIAQHLSFARDIMCIREGPQLCLAKQIELAKSMNVFEQAVDIFSPPSINLTQTSGGNHSEVKFAIDYIQKFVDQYKALPNNYVCTNCFKTMTEQAHSWYKTVLEPRIKQYSNQPELSAQVEKLVSSANEKCGANFVQANKPVTIGNAAQYEIGSDQPSSSGTIQYSIITLLLLAATVVIGM
ncbi:hypothetical protein BKA69DRAFT_1038203 [Paraphysoderma sedebokerense]|nr:hypothetical protein BKA69DRAFT_1038203 [Paraphysoderma sedebokerense]